MKCYRSARRVLFYAGVVVGEKTTVEAETPREMRCREKTRPKSPREESGGGAAAA